MKYKQDIVHLYYKRDFGDHKILVRVNPIHFDGTEITVYDNGEMYHRDMVFDENIVEDLETDEFKQASPLEFNLYLKGFGKTES